MPTTWIEAKRCWGMPERRGQPVHPLEAELPADRLQRVEVGLPRGVYSVELLELGPVALELRRAPPRPARPAPWRRTSRWRACPRRAATSERSSSRRFSSRAATALGVDLGRGEHLTGPTEAIGSPPSSARTRSGESRPTNSCGSLPLDAGRELTRGRRLDQVAPGAQAAGQLDRRARPRPRPRGRTATRRRPGKGCTAR